MSQPRYFSSNIKICIIIFNIIGLSNCSNQHAPDPSPSPNNSHSQVNYSKEEIIRRNVIESKDPNIIKPQSYSRVFPLIASLTIDPPEIILKVGEVFSLNKIKVTALDSSSNPLGRLEHYSRGCSEGAIKLQGFDDIVALKPGEGAITISASLFIEKTGIVERGKTSLKVVVVQ